MSMCQKEVGLFGRLLSLFGGEDSEADLVRKAFVQELTAEPGWDIKMVLGSEPARKVGGSGDCASVCVCVCVSCVCRSFFFFLCV